MGLVGGTGIGGGPVPPEIQYENPAQEDIKKAQLAMLPADTLEVVPFTKVDEESKYQNYKTDPNIPKLYHAPVRSATSNEFLNTEGWKDLYESFVNSLPEDVKAALEYNSSLPPEERDLDMLAFNNVLITTAMAVDGLSASTIREADISSEMRNELAPYIVMRGVLSHTLNVMEFGNEWIQSLGPNDPNYDAVSYFLEQTRTLADELNAIRKEAEKKEISEEDRSRLEVIADRFEKLSVEFQRSPVSEGFIIFGENLKALSMVANSWSMSSGSPTLFLSLATATHGIEGDKSSLSLVGGNWESLLSGITSTLLEETPRGTAVEIKEMESLYEELTKLSTGTEG